MQFPIYLGQLGAGLEVEEPIKFMLLQRCLGGHRHAKAELEARLEEAQKKGKKVNFSDFWTWLTRTYGEDLRGAPLAEMKSMQPDWGSRPGHLTLENFSRYKTDFLRLFARLPDVQEEEVRDWVLQHLP